MSFTTIARVRLHAQLHDPEWVTDELLTQRIADAHGDILRDLAAAHHESDEETLAAAETELVTAYVLRSLASRAAAESRDLRTGEFRLNTRHLPQALRDQADEEERRAWGRLAPFLRARSSRFAFGTASPTKPGDPDRHPKGA